MFYNEIFDKNIFNSKLAIAYGFSKVGDYYILQSDIDVENFKEKALQVSLGFAQLTDIVEWRLKNDEVQQFTLKEILEVLAIWGKRKVDIFQKFNKLYVKFMMILDEDELRQFMKEVEEEWK